MTTRADSATSTATRVVIAGGGVGGLEAALALRAIAGPQISVTVLSAGSRFIYKPWSVATPFGHRAAVEVDLAQIAADRGFELIEGRLLEVEANAHRASTTVGDLEYDFLVLALGAQKIPSVEGAFSFAGPQDAAALTELLAEDRLADDAQLVFVANASAAWSLPAYELALQTAERARRSDRRLRVALTTAERSPLEDFGPNASAAVAALLTERAVEVHTHTIPASFDGRSLFVPMAGRIPADVVVALPALVGLRVPGIPHEPTGFIEVDDVCRVRGIDDVFAVGDMTARKLKQGGLTTQQSDVVATVIAAAAGVPVAVEPYVPVLRAMLLTGGRPLYLRYPPGAELRPDAETGDAPWWPPHKVIGTHLGPYLATHSELLVTR